MIKKDKKGKLFVITGPSGVGKGTLLSALLKQYTGINVSVSATTRKPRPGEVDGVNYHFVSKEEFENLIQKGELLEWAEFAGNYYGTFVKTVKESLDNNQNLALEIEVQGAMQVKNKIPEAVMIFILPPSLEELENRLIGRNTETDEVRQKRLAAAEKELTQTDIFTYKVVNDNVEDALAQLKEIITSESE